MGDDPGLGLYFRVKRDSDGDVESFKAAATLEELKTISGTEDSQQKSNVDSPVSDNTADRPIGSISHYIRRALDNAFSQTEMFRLQASLQVGFPIMTFESHIIPKIEASAMLVEEGGDGEKVYYGSQKLVEEVMPAIIRMKKMGRALEALPSALLMSVVATFDSITSDIVREKISTGSGAFGASGQMVPIRDVLSAASIEDLKEKLISDELYKFSRGSHEEQVKYIEKNFHVKIIEHWKRWPDFTEVFERRNLVAHGETQFTQRYVEICLHHGHKGSEKTLGSEIELHEAYLKQASDVLLEFLLLLVFSLERKRDPSDLENTFSALNQAAYELITGKNYVVARHILEYCLDLRNSGVTEDIRQMMVVNLASSLRHMGEKKSCDDVLQKVDWSASSDKYKICVAALRDRVQEVIALLPQVVAAKAISVEDLHTWPVFDFVNESQEFKIAVSELSGEKTASSSSSSSIIPPSYQVSLDTLKNKKAKLARAPRAIKGRVVTH